RACRTRWLFKQSLSTRQYLVISAANTTGSGLFTLGRALAVAGGSVNRWDNFASLVFTPIPTRARHFIAADGVVKMIDWALIYPPHSWLTFSLAALMGLLLGSFLNVVI